MFKTILVGYDGPERGGEATALGERLRDPRTGTLLLTSVYALAPLTADGVMAPDELQERRDGTDEMLAEARDGLRKPARVQICAVASYSPGRALREVAETEHADLVVVGSGHRSAVGQPLPGTAAERLLHDLPCPVAVVPRGYSGGDIRRIGVADDGSPAAASALRAAESLALELDASLTVYHVGESSTPSGAVVTAGNAPQGLRLETLVVTGVPAEEIAGRAYGVIDLLFVGACDDGPLRRALLGNVSGQLVRAAGCPVVVVPRTGVAPRRGLDAAVEANACVEP